MAQNSNSSCGLEEKYSKSLLLNLDELVEFLHQSVDRNLSPVQQKIVIRNLFQNILKAAGIYFNLVIENLDLYQSILVQTSTVLNMVSSELDYSGPFNELKEELNTEVNHLVVKIVNARAGGSYETVFSTSHIVGEFLNNLELIQNFPKVPLRDPQTYFNEVLQDYIYYHSLTLVYARPIIQLKLLPKEWIINWTKYFFIYTSFLIDYVDSLNFRQFVRSNPSSALQNMRKFLDLYVEIAVLSYKVAPILGEEFVDITSHLKISDDNLHHPLVRIFKFASAKITTLMETWTGIFNELGEIRESLDLLNEYGFMIGKALDLASNAIEILYKIQISKSSILPKEIDLLLPSIRDILSYYEVNQERVSQQDEIIQSDVREIDDIIFGLYCSLLYYKMTSTRRDRIPEFLKFIHSYIPNINLKPRSSILVYLLYFNELINDQEIDISKIMEEIKSLLDKLTNPFDEISLQILQILFLQKIDKNNTKNLDSLFSNLSKKVNQQMGISHLKSELLVFISYLEKKSKLHINLLNGRLKDSWSSDPFSIIKPRVSIGVESEIIYVPFNREIDLVLPREHFT